MLKCILKNIKKIWDNLELTFYVRDIFLEIL